MGIVRFTLNFLLMLAMWTTMGQFSYGGIKLEQRYHGWVNSSHMQQVFDTAFMPFRWSTTKMASLWNDLAPSKSQAR